MLASIIVLFPSAHGFPTSKSQHVLEQRISHVFAAGLMVSEGGMKKMAVNEMPIDEPVDNETDVAVEAESLELELEEDNDDESVELEEDDDEDDISARESHSILIGGTLVLKSSIAKKGRGENSVFVHFCWCRCNNQEVYHAVLHRNLCTKKICM